MSTRTNYESTIAPPTRTGYGTGTSAGTLGVRDDTGLQAAFVGNVGVRGEAGLEYARTQMENIGLGEASGTNQMFPEYRRNFIPEETTEEYVKPRDKSSVPVGVGTGLGTAYTPTIASPGEANGLNSLNLPSVKGSATQVLGNAFDAEGKLQGTAANYDPSAASHKNTDGQSQIDNVGAVRRFKLGVGSGANNGASPATTRAQFPATPASKTPT